MIFCTSVLSVVISPFSFLILLIWFFSLFFLMSLANGLSILFTFSMHQLLVLLIFTIVSFVFYSSISALIFYDLFPSTNPGILHRLSFQILKGDAVKVLHSICQQIWKMQQWPQDWKRSVFIPIPKKGNAKECSNYHTIALISHARKVMLKILQARLQ